MTFADYWKPFGSDPEEVAELAWNAAVEAERDRCAKIAEDYPWMWNSSLDIRAGIAALIRKGEK